MLTKEDYIIIEILISLAEDIYSSTMALYKLELFGKKDTQEYTKHLNSIKDNNVTFTHYLSILAKDYQKLLATYDYLIKKDYFSHLDATKSGLKMAFCTRLDDQYATMFAFIKNRIYQKIIEDYKYLITLISDDYSDISDEEYKRAVKDVLFFQQNYTCKIIDDVYMLFLTLIEQEKGKTSSKEIIEKLTKLKYSYSLMLPYLHDYLLDKRYEVDESPFIMHHSFANIYQMDEEDFQESKKNIILNIVAGNIELIKYLEDDKILDYQNVALAIDIDATIRACIVVADKETRETIKDMLDTMINELENSDDYSVVVQILKKIFEREAKDLSLVRIVTIINPKHKEE